MMFLMSMLYHIKVNQMNCLQSESQQVIFSYQEKGHLESTVTFHNKGDSIAFYKFKVTRPKYYLIKPDHGFCKPNQQVKVHITLHQDGVKEGEGDKFKLYYKFMHSADHEPHKHWQKQADAMSLKFVVIIKNLPAQYKQNESKTKQSDLKSLFQSKFEGNHANSEIDLQERENRVTSLRMQVEQLKNNPHKLIHSSGGQHLKQYLMAALIGLSIGIISAIWT